MHWVILGLSVAVLALAAVLKVGDGVGVVLPILGWPLPELCTSRRLLGFECPGCGLTRSFIAIMHGDLARAWFYNPAGLLVFAAIAFQVPYRTVQLNRARRGKPSFHTAWLDGTWIIVGAALITQWIARWW
jgi:hypothetical protein